MKRSSSSPCLRPASALAADPNGELVRLAAPIPDGQNVQFYRIHAKW